MIMSAMTARKTRRPASNSFHFIVILSAWGFSLVISSLLFLWLGRLLDELLGTGPKFMLGFFILSIIGCFIVIYREATDIMKHA